VWYFILDPPKPRVFPDYSAYHVSINAKLVLNCSADGYPTPTIRWYKDDILISNPKANYSVIDAQTNVLGTTVYKCMAINYVGGVEYYKGDNITVNIESNQICAHCHA